MSFSLHFFKRKNIIKHSLSPRSHTSWNALDIIVVSTWFLNDIVVYNAKRYIFHWPIKEILILNCNIIIFYLRSMIAQNPHTAHC